jgi:Tfp pilus assembly protein PilN
LSEVTVSTGGPPKQVIGLSVIGAVAVVGIGAYFAMAQVSNIRDEAAQLRADAQAAQTNAASLNQQAIELGQNVGFDMDAVLVNYREQLLTTLDERIDYAKLLEEVAAVKPSGAWYTSVESTTSQSDDSLVTLQGVAPTYDDVTALVVRLNSSASMDGARITLVEPAEAVAGARKGEDYIKFTIEARFEASTLDTSSGSTSTDGSLVSDGGSTADDIALDPAPAVPKKIVPVKPPPPPPNPYESASDSASGEKSESGGSK